MAWFVPWPRNGGIACAASPRSTDASPPARHAGSGLTYSAPSSKHRSQLSARATTSAGMAAARSCATMASRVAADAPSSHAAAPTAPRAGDTTTHWSKARPPTPP